MLIPASVIADIQQKHRLEILDTSPVGGGCIHHAYRIQTQSGKLFVKYNRIAQAQNFEVERKGLHQLADSRCVKVPKVIACEKTSEYAYLLMEFIEPGRRGARFWEELGNSLGNLHNQSQDSFGLAYDNYIGALPQSNSLHDSWTGFFVSERIQPMLQIALNRGKISRGLLGSFESLFGKLDQYFPEESPALIHGDLWGGNLLTGSDGSPVLIDPAIYFGHRECELAFMTMFDSQPPEFYRAYEEVRPLEVNWQERLDLYNLYPLLVHVNLFGGGYIQSVKQILKRFI